MPRTPKEIDDEYSAQCMQLGHALIQIENLKLQSQNFQDNCLLLVRERSKLPLPKIASAPIPMEELEGEEHA